MAVTDFYYQMLHNAHGKVSVDRTFSLNGQALPSSDSCKDLGVGLIVNSNLIPSSHIASITVTANQRVNLIVLSFLVTQTCWHVMVPL